MHLSTFGHSLIPKPIVAMSIGYENTTNLIWLIGGNWPHRSSLISFNISIWNETNAFEDHGSVLSSYQFESLGQTYVQKTTTVCAVNTLNSSQLLIFDISTRDVKTVTENNLTLYTYGCLASVGDLIIYTNLDQTYIMTISSQSWRLSGNPKMLQPRWYHSCMIEPNAGFLYVIGGAPILNSIEKLYVNDIANINQYNFTLLTDTLSRSKWGTRSILYQTDIYIIGGAGGQGQYCDDIDVIDTTTDSVNLWGTLSIATAFTTPIIIGSRVYVFGGRGDNETAFDTWQYFDVFSISIYIY